MIEFLEWKHCRNQRESEGDEREGSRKFVGGETRIRGQSWDKKKNEMMIEYNPTIAGAEIKKRKFGSKKDKWKLVLFFCPKKIPLIH